MSFMSKKQNDSQNVSLKRTTQTNLWLRIFVGAFIIYMMADVVKGLSEVSQKDFVILATLSVLLIAGAVCIIVWSVYRLIKKDYYDPQREISDANEDASKEEIKKEET